MPRKPVSHSVRELIARRFSSAVKRADLTTDEVAEAANITPQYVRRIRKGTVGVSVDVLAFVARAVGLEPWELLRRKNGKRSGTPDQ